MATTVCHQEPHVATTVCHQEPHVATTVCHQEPHVATTVCHQEPHGGHSGAVVPLALQRATEAESARTWPLPTHSGQFLHLAACGPSRDSLDCDTVERGRERERRKKSAEVDCDCGCSALERSALHTAAHAQNRALSGLGPLRSPSLIHGQALSLMRSVSSRLGSSRRSWSRRSCTAFYDSIHYSCTTLVFHIRFVRGL